MANRMEEFGESLSDQFKAAMAVENGEGLMLAYSTPGDGFPPHSVILDGGPGRRLVLTPTEAREFAALVCKMADKAEGK